MNSNKVISIDAMGGDNSPSVIIEGLSIALNNFDNFSAILFGDEDKIKSEIKKNSISENKIEIIHCEKVVPMDAKPIDAIRRIGKESSMWGCIKSVSDGNSDIAISAGNTGALMGLSAIILKKLEGIERPAIASYWPNINGRSVVLDLGGNVEVSSDQLVQFAILGYAHALSALEKQNPSIGLLNIGHEEMKGTENIQEASKKMTSLFNENYIGYIEGDDISLGKSEQLVGALISSKKGSLIGPVKTSRGYGVVKVENIAKFDSANWEVSKDLIRNDLMAKKERETYGNWMNNLKEEANIVDNRKYHF